VSFVITQIGLCIVKQCQRFILIISIHHYAHTYITHLQT